VAIRLHDGLFPTPAIAKNISPGGLKEAVWKSHQESNFLTAMAQQRPPSTFNKPPTGRLRLNWRPHGRLRTQLVRKIIVRYLWRPWLRQVGRRISFRKIHRRLHSFRSVSCRSCFAESWLAAGNWPIAVRFNLSYRPLVLQTYLYIAFDTSRY